MPRLLIMAFLSSFLLSFISNHISNPRSCGPAIPIFFPLFPGSSFPSGFSDFAHACPPCLKCLVSSCSSCDLCVCVCARACAPCSQIFNRVLLPMGGMGVIFLLRFSWISLSLTSRHLVMVYTGVGVSVLILFGLWRSSFLIWGVPGVSVVKNLPVNAGDSGSIPGSGRFPWRRKWQPTPVFLLG